MPTPPTRTTQRIVREYSSSKAFYKDANELYARSHYTVSDTTGLAHRRFFTRALMFFRLRPEHLVITYQSPINPWPVNADAH